LAVDQQIRRKLRHRGVDLADRAAELRCELARGEPGWRRDDGGEHFGAGRPHGLPRPVSVALILMRARKTKPILAHTGAPTRNPIQNALMPLFPLRTEARIFRKKRPTPCSEPPSRCRRGSRS